MAETLYHSVRRILFNHTNVLLNVFKCNGVVQENQNSCVPQSDFRATAPDLSRIALTNYVIRDYVIISNSIYIFSNNNLIFCWNALAVLSNWSNLRRWITFFSCRTLGSFQPSKYPHEPIYYIGFQVAVKSLLILYHISMKLCF